MPSQAVLVRPQLRESDEAWIKRIDGRIVSDASVQAVGRLDQSAEVWKYLLDLLRREAKKTKYGYGWIHE